MLNNTYESLLEEAQTKRLIVFGCGRYFEYFVSCYPTLNEKIEFILDNAGSRDRYNGNGLSIPVIQPKEIKRFDREEYVIVFCSLQWREMKKQLDAILGCDYTLFHYPLDVDYRRNKALGIRHRIILPAVRSLRDHSTMKKALELTGTGSEEELIKDLERKEIHTIPRLVVVLTPKCSLRCKDCNNLMWAFSKTSVSSGEGYNLSTEKIIASLCSIMASMDFIPCVELIGGEPFVARHMDEVLGFLLGQEKVLAVEITTNATIIPREEILGQLKNPKVTVHVSDYGSVVDQGKFLDCMKENGICFKLLKLEGRWVSPGGTEARNRDGEELIRQYYRCSSGYLCKTLWEDKIYPCARAASLAELGIMQDCPRISGMGKEEPEELRERLYSFYVVPSCGPCDHCDLSVENPVYVEPAVQMEIPIKT